MHGASGLNILVTGGAGFIGSNLCDRLIQKGHHVICVDSLVSSEFNNIQPLLNHPHFEFIQHDVRDPLTIRGPIDRIYNLACPASPPHYQRERAARDDRLFLPEGAIAGDGGCGNNDDAARAPSAEARHHAVGPRHALTNPVGRSI